MRGKAARTSPHTSPSFLSRGKDLGITAAATAAAVAAVAALGAAAGFAIAARRRKARRQAMRGKVVIVTGSSRGLGLVLAEEFGRLGARIVLTARNGEELDRARDPLNIIDAVQDPDDLLVVPADLRVKEDAEYVIHRAVEKWGRVDILVNNAGIITVGPIENQTVQQFREVMDANFFTGVHCTLAALPAMLERGEGTIVNIASIGGKVSVPHLLPYSASKFAAVGFSEGLHAELRGKGVHVITVCPGLMRTGSHLNAYFTGNAEREYQWFALGATTPGISASAGHAARRIVRAVLSHETELFITPQAAVAGRGAQLMPQFTALVLGLVNKLLPNAATDSAPPQRGADVRAHEPITAGTLGWDAARRYNELGGLPQQT